MQKNVCVVSLAGDNFQMKCLNQIKIVFHRGGGNVLNARLLNIFLNWLLRCLGLKFPKYYYINYLPL